MYLGGSFDEAFIYGNSKNVTTLKSYCITSEKKWTIFLQNKLRTSTI
jgi:hypothetical protein